MISNDVDESAKCEFWCFCILVFCILYFVVAYNGCSDDSNDDRNDDSNDK